MLILRELERRPDAVRHRALHVPRPAVLTVGRVELEPVNLGIVELNRVAVRRPRLDELLVLADDRVLENIGDVYLTLPTIPMTPPTVPPKRR